MKIKDPNDPNKEIEVFTAEEVEAKTKEAATKAATDAANAAIEKYKQENPDKTGEIETLKNTLAAKTAELEAALGFDDGSPERKAQIERLRKERDAQVTELNGKVETLTQTIKSMQDTQVATAKQALLDRFAGTDPEARKKVEFEFDKYDPTNTTPEGMAARMEKAAGLAGVTTPATPGPLDGGPGGGARGQGNYGGSGPVKVTDNAKNLGTALGVTPEELAKYAEAKNGETKK